MRPEALRHFLKGLVHPNSGNVGKTGSIHYKVRVATVLIFVPQALKSVMCDNPLTTDTACAMSWEASEPTALSGIRIQARRFIDMPTTPPCIDAV